MRVTGAGNTSPIWTDYELATLVRRLELIGLFA